MPPPIRQGARVALQRVWFLGGLLCLIGFVLLVMRYRESSAAHCIASPQEISAAQSPDRIDATHPQRARYAIEFDMPEKLPSRMALSIGSARPFYRLTLNGADLTPGVDMGASNIRDLAPHLHVLPPELLRARGNVARLELPMNPALGPQGVAQVCIAPLTVLGPTFEANWWRMIGAARVGLALQIALVILGSFLWWLNGRPAAYLWYIGLVMVLIVRTGYAALPERPGGSLLWMHIGNASLIALPYLLYGLMRAHWSYALPWLVKALSWCTGAALTCLALRALGLPPRQDAWASVVFVLLTLSSALMVAMVILLRARFMHRIERRVLFGICTFAFVVVLPETLDGWLPFGQRWAGASALAMTVLAMGMGYLLVRRMAIGGFVLNAATESLAGDLDQALAEERLPPRRLWAQLTASISERERQRLIRDIHDGFGSRLVGVLAQARRELPHSPLRAQIQRALLDMRLMIDAMDESARSLGAAMARFRHRFEQANATAIDCCDWKFGGLDEVVIGNRSRLIAVYRCLEELLSEALSGLEDESIVIAVHAGYDTVDFVVVGGAGWSDDAVARIKRLIRSARGKVYLYDDTQLPRCAFSVPMF
ncbi:MAG: hypothetical protein IT467_10895 [Dokdonella sp.]|nr:hypothetical protein [Dokdonella sp.]